MLRQIYLATSKMLTNLRWQEVIEHNLSGLNVPGYRETLVSLGIAEEHPLLRVEKGRAVPLGASVTFNVSIDSLTVNQSQGPLRDTGYFSHLAIVGDGYFAVRRPNGAVEYTRNGEFVLSPNGTLTLADGSVLLDIGGGPVRFGENYTVRSDGSVFDGSGNYVTQIGVYRLTGIRDLGGGFYTGVATPSAAAVLQGYLEKANVDVVKQMTSMIMALRSFQAASRVVSMSDETVGKLINTLS